MWHGWRWTIVCGGFLAAMWPGVGLRAVEVIVDNNNANNSGGNTFTILSGGSGAPSGWRNASSASGYYGTDYTFKETTTFGNTPGEVEWRPSLPSASQYEVAVRYTQGANRSTAAPYTVDFTGGSQTINVNQQTGGGQWLVIGTFSFPAGTSGRVRLSNQTTGSVVIADAVRFTSVAAAPELTLAVSPLGAGSTVPGSGTTTRVQDEVVNLSATANTGYVFSQWLVSAGSNVANPASATTTVTMDQSKTVTAVFTPTGGAAPEFRGMWITRFEWPSTSMTTVQNNLNTFFQKCKDNNFNAVIVQMRGQADTLYPSPYEPWSQIVSSSGNTPSGWGSFDPMAYAITAAHSRGLEFHAYINTHVCWQSSTSTPPNNPNHLYYQHCNAADPAKRDWLIHNSSGNPVQYEESSYVWMAPGVPDFQAYTRKQVMHVVENYNVDGVHFDRIRCPSNGFSYDPISQARKAGEGNPDSLDHASWTRDQITRFLRDLYAQIMEIKPHIKVSSAPLGLYWGPRYVQYGYPQSACGFQYGYSCVYQDAQAWLAAGAQDFIVPQIYWPDEPWRTTNPHFSQILPDWLSNRAGRHIYAGQTTGVSHTAPALVHEINVTRTPDLNGNTGQGNVIFSYSSFNSNNWWSSYSGAGAPYEQPAPVPEMPWKTNPTTGIIIGHVTGADGVTPVVDAQITRGGSSYVALSSGDGLYSFLLVPPGTYTLVCNKIGLGQKVVPNVTVAAGQVRRVNISYAPPPTRTIVAWRSVRTHGPAGALAIALDPAAAGNGVNGPTVEPRSGGIQKIEVQFDGPITLASPDGVTVVGQSTANGSLQDPIPYPPAVSVAGSTLSLAFAAGELPDQTCYTVIIGPGTLNENVAGGANCMIRALAGDTTGGGSATLTDAIWTATKAGAAGSDPRHDVDLSGTIDSDDVQTIKGGLATPPRAALCP